MVGTAAIRAARGRRGLARVEVLDASRASTGGRVVETAWGRTAWGTTGRWWCGLTCVKILDVSRASAERAMIRTSAVGTARRRAGWCGLSSLEVYILDVPGLGSAAGWAVVGPAAVGRPRGHAGREAGGSILCGSSVDADGGEARSPGQPLGSNTYAEGGWCRVGSQGQNGDDARSQPHVGRL